MSLKVDKIQSGLFSISLYALDSGINVAPGIFGKNIKRSPYNRHPSYNQAEDILKKMCITLSK